MKAGNVETIKGLYAAYDRGDLAAVFALFSEDIVWDASRLGGVAVQPVYRGHDGIRAFWREWLVAWESVEFLYDEFIEVGDRVVVVLRQRMRGRSSRVDLEMDPYAQVWTFSGEGKIVRMEFFPTKEEGLSSVE